MFNSIVLPHFTYCDIIWASSDETNISRLQKLQNTCARVILNENRRSHVQPMQDSLSWMPIIDLIKYHTLVAVYKINVLVALWLAICITFLCKNLEYTATLPGRQI